MNFFYQFSRVSEIPRSLILLLISTFLCFDGLAQPEDEHKELLEWHDREIGVRSLGIINGPVYKFIRVTGETHAYFNKQYWTEGNIRLDGQTYYNLPLVYNIHEDLIITKHPDLRYNLGISLRNVEGFRIYDRSFIWLDHPDIVNGYYEESFKGSLLNIYTRRIKKARVDEKNTNFVLKTYIYLEAGGSMYRFMRMKDLYKAMPEQESRIRSIRKEYKLKPSHKRFGDLLKLAILMEEMH